jgi:hypothetical protein
MGIFRPAHRVSQEKNEENMLSDHQVAASTAGPVDYFLFRKTDHPPRDPVVEDA